MPTNTFLVLGYLVMLSSVLHLACSFACFLLISWPPISAQQYKEGQTNCLLLLACIFLSTIALATQVALVFRPASRRVIMLNTCASLLIFLLEVSTFVRLNLYIQESVEITKGLAEAAAAARKSQKHQSFAGDEGTIKKCCQGWKLFQHPNLTGLFPRHWLPTQCCKLLHAKSFDCDGVKPQETAEFKSYACVQDHLKLAANHLRVPNTLLLLPLIYGMPVYMFFTDEIVSSNRTSRLRHLTEVF